MGNSNRYKYTIVINQKAYVDLGINLSFELTALLYYLIGFCENKDERIEKQRVRGYTWMNYKKILHDMPLLRGRTEASVTGNIDKLEKFGFIKTTNTMERGRPRKYIKLTDLCEIIKGGFEHVFDEKYYGTFLRIGMNARQAKEVASNKEFLKDAEKVIGMAIRSKTKENKAGYIWKVYDSWKKGM